MQILKKDKEGNLKLNKGIVIAQRIIVDWEKNKIQKAYIKDIRARELRKKQKDDNGVQMREGILY